MGVPPTACLPAALVAASIVATVQPASANELGFGGHVAYGLGGAVAGEEIGSGLRHNLDASFLIGSFREKKSSIGLWANRSGWMAGPMVATGFAEYPTYLGAEGGFGADAGMVGWTTLLGLVARAYPEAGGGVTLRAAADFVLLELGVRPIVIFLGEPEFQLTGTIGVGRF